MALPALSAIGATLGGEALKGLTGAVGGLAGNLLGGSDVTVTNNSGTTTQKKVLTQEVFDKIISDIMGSEQGLSALLQGQNVAGLYGSSTNTLMAQKFVDELAGTLASITAETVTTNDSRQEQKKRKKSVICTALKDTGRLSPRIHKISDSYFQQLPDETVYGYMAWGSFFAEKIRKNPHSRLSNFWLKVVWARYHHLAGRPNLLGWFSVAVLQNFSTLVGKVLKIGEKNGHQAAVN